MDPPDLDLLQAGDEGSWDAAFKWLWPTAFAVAKNKLYYRWPNEVEDIAIDSITKLIRHVHKVKKVEELKALLAKITHDECAGFIRKNLAIMKLADQIMKLADQLKPKERLVFEEFLINGLSYEEISNKHDIKIGSVGVYLKRALENLRNLLGGMGENFL